MFYSLILFPFLALGVIGLLCGLSQYTHIKQHVYVERFIKKTLTKKLHARVVRRVHSKTKTYRQCHRLIGIGYMWEHDSPHWKSNGFTKIIEKSLPDTISTDFEFKKPQKQKRITDCVVSAFPKSKFVVTSHLRDKNIFLISYKRSESMHAVSVHIIRLRDIVGHRRYRLICTWLSTKPL